MNSNRSKHRLYSILLALGASILIYRTISLLSQDILNIARVWVGVLLFIEMAIDISCFIAAIIWGVRNTPGSTRIALRLGTAAAFMHAFRVLIFVLGRTGPWHNFDVRPEHIATHSETWTWGGVWFAATMSILGILGVIVIWQIRKYRLKKNN